MPSLLWKVSDCSERVGKRDIEQKGGGVLLYVRNEIVACELTEIRNGRCEAVGIQVRNHNGVKSE